MPRRLEKKKKQKKNNKFNILVYNDTYSFISHFSVSAMFSTINVYPWMSLFLPFFPFLFL